jgi:hypothetical protein
MAKNSAPIKPKKARKLAAGPECWPYEYEDIHQWWALEAIRHGNAAILAQHLGEVDEIDTRVRRELSEIVSPTSSHFWRLQVIFRFRGPPSKRAKEFKRVFTAAMEPLAKLLSGADPIGRMPPNACRNARSEIASSVATRLQAAK